MSDVTPPVDLEQKTLEMVGKLENLAIEMAPQAWELSLASIQIQGIAYVCIGIVFAVITLVLVTVCVKNAFAGVAAEQNETDRVEVHFVFTVISGLMSVPSAIATMINLFDVNNWIAAFAPASALALRLIG